MRVDIPTRSLGRVIEGKMRQGRERMEVKGEDGEEECALKTEESKGESV